MATKKPKLFIQDWGTFPNETLVCIGGNYDDMVKYLNVHKLKSGFMEEYKERIVNETEKKSRGLAIVVKDGQSILWLREYSWKKWEDVECLIHEIHHLIYFMSHQKGFDEELEAQAYQMEYLFRNIRKKIVNYKGAK